MDSAKQLAVISGTSRSVSRAPSKTDYLAWLGLHPLRDDSPFTDDCGAVQLARTVHCDVKVLDLNSKDNLDSHHLCNADGVLRAVHLRTDSEGSEEQIRLDSVNLSNCGEAVEVDKLSGDNGSLVYSWVNNKGCRLPPGIKGGWDSFDLDELKGVHYGDQAVIETVPILVGSTTGCGSRASSGYINQVAGHTHTLRDPVRGLDHYCYMVRKTTTKPSEIFMSPNDSSGDSESSGAEEPVGETIGGSTLLQSSQQSGADQYKKDVQAAEERFNANILLQQNNFLRILEEKTRGIHEAYQSELRSLNIQLTELKKIRPVLEQPVLFPKPPMVPTSPETEDAVPKEVVKALDKYKEVLKKKSLYLNSMMASSMKGLYISLFKNLRRVQIQS